ncbi:MAG TPA: hypothetical protein PKW33_04780 [Anaerolineaceae bacterium]|nr:hypothetical protein [Anaerolineaceae bacterium]HPN50877.1 hypothetical protein [Anaerolineaceae bacterium]
MSHYTPTPITSGLRKERYRLFFFILLPKRKNHISMAASHADVILVLK